MTSHRISGTRAYQGEMRAPGLRRVSFGLYRTWHPDRTADETFANDLEAWLLVLPEGAVFTHVTAARLLGWWLPALPEQTPVFAAVTGDVSRPRRPGLLCSRLERPLDAVQAGRFLVDRPEEVLLRAARDLGVLDVTIMVDSARRLGHIDSERLEAVLDSRRPGVRVLRRAVELSDPAAESGGEVLLRVFHQCIEVPVLSQVDLYDELGTFLGRADLLVRGTSQVHEYDGAVHRSARTHRRDLRRERALLQAGYSRRGFSFDDLVRQPAATVHEIDRALARPHRPRGLRSWRRLVRDSLFSATGRERVLNRWTRLTPGTEWSQTA